MRKLLILLTTIGIFFATISNSFAALDDDTVWEVRGGAGSDNSGGGWNPKNASVGTDFSQQDAAQDNGTDLACADGDAAAPVVTSASHNFVAADNGNLIQITAGASWTVGFYEIVSTATNAATLDRAVGTDGALTSGTWAYGGALNTLNKVAANLVGENLVWVKTATYTEAAGDEVVDILQQGGSRRQAWVGYKTTRGDNPIGTDRPVVDAADARLYAVNMNVKQNVAFLNFIFKRGTTNCINDTFSGNYFYNCRFTDSVTGVDTNGGANFWDCEFDNNSDKGLGGSSQGTFKFYNCYAHDNGSSGIQPGFADGSEIRGSIADTNAGDGFRISRGNANETPAPQIEQSIAFNNTTDGFDFSDGTWNIAGIGRNNISQDNGAYGFRGSANGTLYMFDYNCYEGNATAGLLDITAGDNDVTGDPLFTDALGGDFTLLTNSPCLDAGWNMTDIIGNLTGDFKWNIGVDQDDVAAAGGGATGHGWFSN